VHLSSDLKIEDVLINQFITFEENYRGLFILSIAQSGRVLAMCSLAKESSSQFGAALNAREPLGAVSAE
jgi:hypothetical protein